jgi:hypothetical protein
MKKVGKRDPELLPEYDFSRGRRGRYARRYARGANIVVLDPDVAECFSDSRSVNQALRSLMDRPRRGGGKRATAHG